MTKQFRKGLKLNVKPIEAIIRALLAFGVLSMIIVLHQMWATILICVVATYLIVTALLLFCPVKSFFQHNLEGKKTMTDTEKEMPFKDL